MVCEDTNHGKEISYRYKKWPAFPQAIVITLVLKTIFRSAQYLCPFLLNQHRSVQKNRQLNIC